MFFWCQKRPTVIFEHFQLRQPLQRRREDGRPDGALRQPEVHRLVARRGGIGDAGVVDDASSKLGRAKDEEQLRRVRRRQLVRIFPWNDVPSFVLSLQWALARQGTSLKLQGPPVQPIIKIVCLASSFFNCGAVLWPQLPWWPSKIAVLSKF